MTHFHFGYFKILCLNHIDPRECSILDLEAQIAKKYQQSLMFDAPKKAYRQPDVMRDGAFYLKGASIKNCSSPKKSPDDFVQEAFTTGWTWLWGIINNSNGGFILTYNGKVLRPNNSLEDYVYYTHKKCGSNHHQLLDSSCEPSMGGCTESLSPPMTIHASHELKGGCFIISFSILLLIIGSVFMSVFTCGLSLFVIPFLCPLLFILPLFCL